MNIVVYVCRQCNWMGMKPKANQAGMYTVHKCPKCNTPVVQMTAEDYDFEELHQELVEKLGINRLSSSITVHLEQND